MQSIRKRLSILFFICSIASLIIIAFFVNITINKTFDKYILDIQDTRHERIISYFEEEYRREGKWTENSGTGSIHEAYMGNYCLTLTDSNNNVIWGMDPNDIQSRQHLKAMVTRDEGIYQSKTFEILYEGSIVGYVDIGQYSSILLSQEDIDFKNSINISIIVSGLLTLIVVICMSLFFSKHFSAPIKEVSNMSVSLSNGNFDMKYTTVSNIQELENLRNSVNLLAERLKYQDTLRKRLVADITHEIRTPLNVLQNNLEAMLDEVFPVTTERLNYLNDEVIRFGKLLNNLNILKEFESESIKFNFETIYLDELLKDLKEDFFVASENKNIKLYYEIEPEIDYSIKGDKDKIRQVFINLISNAFKFTQVDGKVEIKLYPYNRSIIVEIKDDGIGIKNEDLPFVFERLYRGDKSRNQIDGSGLGLTIVKNILQFHNATIDVKSEENIGTIFTISFRKDN
ncbi:two-component sensor histidine kinase [Alkalibaculum sp. M08DMB]|uniref:histidine kinase n=1 Tax=Alkalibaculum sporogenes TaxID=2655001 RepID=A0A6A7K5B3_9FIRM|nr:two-component sensor histidine kinase [Alkalibaculum sporogenes]